MKYPIGTDLVENTFNGWTSGFPVWRVESNYEKLYTLSGNAGDESRWTEAAIGRTFHLHADHHKTATVLNKLSAEPHPLDTQVGGTHYKNFAIQPAEFIMANNIPWAEGNAIKYIVRHKSKNGREDLEKAKHYIDMIIAREYSTKEK